jgi:hypothetical protein
MSKTGQYVDDPAKREAVWKNNPQMQDQYGRKLILIGRYWCSCDFNRFIELAKESPADEYIIVVRVSDGRIFSRPRSQFLRNHKHWKRRLETGWYTYIDPITQVIF